MPKTQCPNCQREDQVSALMAKMPVLCKTCGTRVVVQAEQRSTSGIVPTPAAQKAVVPMAPPPILPPPPPMLPPPPVVTKSRLADLVLDIAPTAATTKPQPTKPSSAIIRSEVKRPGTYRVNASRGQRYVARLIDQVLMTFIIMCGIVPLYLFVFKSETYISTALMFLWFCLCLSARWWMVGKTGQDLGKRLLGIKIYKSDSEPAEFYHGVVLREMLFQLPPLLIAIIYNYAPFKDVLGFPASFLILLFWLANAVDPWLIFRSDQKCLHDLIADTIVLQEVKS